MTVEANIFLGKNLKCLKEKPRHWLLCKNDCTKPKKYISAFFFLFTHLTESGCQAHKSLTSTQNDLCNQRYK